MRKAPPVQAFDPYRAQVRMQSVCVFLRLHLSSPFPCWDRRHIPAATGCRSCARTRCNRTCRPVRTRVICAI